MSITDELREYTEEQIKWLDMTKVHYRKLFAIADRIDAEHERAMAAAALIAGVPMTDEAMAEHGWVRLPKDADGEFIRIGDTMEWMTHDKTYQPVIRIVSGVGADVFFAWSGANCQYGQYDAQAFRHYKQPTVEDVLREFGDAWAEWKDGAAMMNPVETFAAKLRLAEEVDG